MPRSANPVPQYFDSDNKILAGGKVFYFNAGTSTPKTTYSDSDETIPNTNPVILDAAGRLPDVFFTGTAKQILKDLNDVQIWERDEVGSVEQISDFNAYDLNISYDAGDIVKFAGDFYLSLQNSNQNNQPNSAFAFWIEIRFIEIYNTTVDYALGRIVQTTDGNMWKSVNSPNQNNNPATDNGTNWKQTLDESKFKDITTETITSTGAATLNSLGVTNNTTSDSLNITNNSVMNGIDAQDTDSVLLKRNASTVYARDDVLGTVSESGGVPTGALMESGSNASGSFTKFADGTMICHLNQAQQGVNLKTWTFPETFSSVPTVTANSERVFASTVAIVVSIDSIFSNLVKFYTKTTAGADDNTRETYLTAIGRWY